MKPLLKAIKEFVRFAPIVKNIWLALSYAKITPFGWYVIIGHSIEYDILLLLLSILFKFCLWHRVLIYSLMLSVTFEGLQNAGYFIAIETFNIAYMVIFSLLLSSVLYYLHGQKAKKRTYSSIK